MLATLYAITGLLIIIGHNFIPVETNMKGYYLIVGWLAIIASILERIIERIDNVTTINKTTS